MERGRLTLELRACRADVSRLQDQLSHESSTVQEADMSVSFTVVPWEHYGGAMGAGAMGAGAMG